MKAHYCMPWDKQTEPVCLYMFLLKYAEVCIQAKQTCKHACVCLEESRATERQFPRDPKRRSHSKETLACGVCAHTLLTMFILWDFTWVYWLLLASMTAACDASTCVDCRCKQVSQVRSKSGTPKICAKKNNCFFCFFDRQFQLCTKDVEKKSTFRNVWTHSKQETMHGNQQPTVLAHSVEIKLSSLIKGQNGSYKFLCLLCCSYLLWIKVKDNTAVVLTSCPRPVAPFNSIQYITYSTVLMEISLPVHRPLLLFSR